ncbi:phenylacetate-CoA oxygenase subunit PaaI [Niastella yeongjuensis]|uniref:Phenylacetate-CoA oxygenase subunit PaaI n=1 Tax=Niastella yeongjuensis TaxID=354355 RepID=A0A1V9EWT6_9BACT|nr:1,2-phenylacetyl-CoA epoxidase subunit PaaC [Niastella yeongjuensis]OQP50334.1 phenylacetate-CoA oxygenase subunit PaaI [Niastella yeongjuensis]SEN39075.1 ring-1,2-phenylacetyl-CoA epoxidase subunit PaaC [Niastella yeongjuensis]
MTKDILYNYTMHLADNALILAQRNSEWCGHGPVLEQDIAITNISLDLIGQARSLYQYAAELINAPSPSIGGGRGEATEDSLAYLRDVRQYKNCLLVEQPNGDWAQTILRQFFFSTYQYLLYQQLQKSTDDTLAAIAEKSLKEVTYHVRWSSEWVVRLGDGTPESHGRLENALEELWMYTGELFAPATYEAEAVTAGFGVEVSALKAAWEQKVNEIFGEATLPDAAAGGREGIYMQTGGKEGVHSEQLGYILAELQYMQRAYPGAEW